MQIRRPFNFKKWIDEHRHLLKPPVGNKCVYEDAEFIIMVVGGPNSRKDYHFDEGEEFFYQLEGEIFLLPPRVPHNPIRGENTVGLVMERKRREGELDGLMWFCENCNEKLYEEFFVLLDIMTQFQGVFRRFYENEELRTCNNCGTVMQPPPVVS